jgi:hypothetical protein
VNLICCGLDSTLLSDEFGEIAAAYCPGCRRVALVPDSELVAERARRVLARQLAFSPEAVSKRGSSAAAPRWHAPLYDEIVFENRRFRPTKIQALIFTRLAASHPHAVHRDELIRRILAAYRRRGLRDGRRRRSAPRDTRLRIFFRGKNRGLFGKGKLVVPTGAGFYRLGCTP